ncbi:hypothetical protein [Ectothiorhodospira marina]|nr:hypothetical protein [Ectothiorhodospira marina]
MKRLVLFKGDEYWRKTVPLIKPRAGYAELYFLFKELNIPCHVVTSVTINAENCSELIKAIEHHNRHIIYRHLSIMHGQGVASIETISNFCVRLGYKKIVFVGIDLNNTNYFYNEERYLALRNKHLIPSTDQVGAVHKTNDPQQKYGHMIVTDVIRCYSEHYSQEGIEFYVENKDSALADFLPVWSLS